MNRELIERRIKTLQQQIKAVEAQGNGLVGAIQDCEYWLQQLEQAEAQKQNEQED